VDEPRKQRHTAKRIVDRLVDEQDVMSCRIRRPECLSRYGARRPTRRTDIATDDAEVNFANDWVWLSRVKTKVHMFTLRLSCSD
jgi:hypothetical protein